MSPLRSAVVWAPKEVVQAVATGFGCLRVWRAASSLIESARISMALIAAAAPMPKSAHWKPGVWMVVGFRVCVARAASIVSGERRSTAAVRGARVEGWRVARAASIVSGERRSAGLGLVLLDGECCVAGVGGACVSGCCERGGCGR